VYEIPRAISLDHEILRVFQQLGLVDAIAPHMEPFTPSEYYGVDGQLIRRMTMVAPPYPQGYTPSMCSRSRRWSVRCGRAWRDAERHRRPRLRSRGVDQGPQAATLQVRGAAGRRARCGALRHRLRRRLQHRAHAARPAAGRPGLRRALAGGRRAGERARPGQAAQGQRAVLRAGAALHAGDRARRTTGAGRSRSSPARTRSRSPPEEETWKLLARWLTPDDGQLWRQASYRFHALVAERWRKGACSWPAMRPTCSRRSSGQGMCQGVRDVTNLAWKLGAVLRGEVAGAAAEAAAGQLRHRAQGARARAHQPHQGVGA
jgi:3-(3-hydroxy-phenyl)propionate hydroxylase